ncbi:hypothetical protein PAXINDRAFT_20801 [Paxillus involutus ATCC 200175]|uniref:Unplaced genomic scaffold PAXINscaffold_1268, whole genome shotgun sequence n=1 Tax=Paxillus involutus ATCC 200175 TaxID=664439 RepID=A0A0C9T3A3_PAXIN|nr:hypothetical protein PAXINDRAFT_20801 [Paxillus involutus ATCC 200175]
MAGTVIKRVQFALVDGMDIDHAQGSSDASTSDEESASSGEDIDMSSPILSPSPSGPISQSMAETAATATAIGPTTLISMTPSSTFPVMSPLQPSEFATIPQPAHITGTDIKMDGTDVASGLSSSWKTLGLGTMSPPPRSHLRALPNLPALPEMVHITHTAVKTMTAHPRPHLGMERVSSSSVIPPTSLPRPQLPPIPRTPWRVVQTAPKPPLPPSDVKALPDVPRRQAAVEHSPAIPVVELDALTITTSPLSPRPIRAMPSRAPIQPLTQSTMATSTQAGPSTQSPAIPPSQSLPSRTVEVIIPPLPGSDQMPALHFDRPMSQEYIRGRRDEIFCALNLPDAVQQMAKDLWSNDRDAEGAFMTDIAVEFSVGDVTSVALDLDRPCVRGPVAPIDPHHDAPLVEAFTKYYTEWVELTLKRRRELVAELMLLRQIKGLDDLIKRSKGLDTEWMTDE